MSQLSQFAQKSSPQCLLASFDSQDSDQTHLIIDLSHLFPTFLHLINALAELIIVPHLQSEPYRVCRRLFYLS